MTKTISKVGLGLLAQAIVLCTLTAVAAEQTEAPTFTSIQYAKKHAKGFVRSAKSQAFLAKASRQSFVSATNTVPAKHSLRGAAGPVEDQGQCGSCWDFSLTTVLRGTLITGGKDPGRLSFNYLLNCATTSAGCDGGDFTAADFLVNPQGAPAYGTDGNYTEKAGTCSPQPVVASAVSYKMLGTDLGAHPEASAPSFQDIAYVVGVLHQPVSIDIAADQTWENYSGGVYNGCSDESANDIDHMVTIEGYDCEKSVDAKGNCVFDATGNLPAGVGTWLVRNSWGESWGDGGYITMKATDKKGLRCNAVATDALYFNIK